MQPLSVHVHEASAFWESKPDAGEYEARVCNRLFVHVNEMATPCGICKNFIHYNATENIILLMQSFSTPAILLRRIEYGDSDFIITFFTLERGKIPVIAKSAKKSVKRFGGLLELFSVLHMVCTIGRGKLPILKEAALACPFINIRESIAKTAYASYWSEIVNEYMEEAQRQEEIFTLLRFALNELDAGNTPEEALSILFQMKFIAISGFSPNLSGCVNCGTPADQMPGRLLFELKRGGLVCGRCAPGPFPPGHMQLSKGTAKQLLWIENQPLEKAGRIRFSRLSMKEGLGFLEAFIPFHIGKKLKSLSFLRRIRAKDIG